MIEFKRLSDVKKPNIIELMNHPKLRLHMPLAKSPFDDAAYDTFIAAKEDLWKTMAMARELFMSKAISLAGAGFNTKKAVPIWRWFYIPSIGD